MDKHSRSYPLYYILLMFLDKSDRLVLNNNYLDCTYTSIISIYSYIKIKTLTLTTFIS